MVIRVPSLIYPGAWGPSEAAARIPALRSSPIVKIALELLEIIPAGGVSVPIALDRIKDLAIPDVAEIQTVKRI